MKTSMAAGIDGEEAFEEGYEKHLGQEPKVDVMEERVRGGDHRNASLAARVKRSESGWKGTVVQDWRQDRRKRERERRQR